MKKSSLYPLMGFLPLVIGFFYIRTAAFPLLGPLFFTALPWVMVFLWVRAGWRSGRPWVAALCRRCPLGGAAGVCVRRVAVCPCPRRGPQSGPVRLCPVSLRPGPRGRPGGRATGGAEQHHLLRPSHRPGHAYERPGPAAALLPGLQPGLAKAPAPCPVRFRRSGVMPPFSQIQPGTLLQSARLFFFLQMC